MSAYAIQGVGEVRGSDCEDGGCGHPDESYTKDNSKDTPGAQGGPHVPESDEENPREDPAGPER